MTEASDFDFDLPDAATFYDLRRCVRICDPCQNVTQDETTSNVARQRMFRRLFAPMALRGPESLHAVDEVFAALHAESPWFAEASTVLWRDAKAFVRNGYSGLKMTPTLLHGPAGCGKSRFARRLAELAEVPVLEIDASKSVAAFSIVGVEAGFKSAQVGQPLRKIAQEGVANIVVIINEIDKVSQPDIVSSLSHALLSLLEFETASAWTCPNLGVRIDMTHVNWLFTANRIDDIDPILRDRLRSVAVSQPSGRVLDVLIRERGRGLSPEVLDHLCFLARDGEHKGRPLSLRRILRALESAHACKETAADDLH